MESPQLPGRKEMEHARRPEERPGQWTVIFGPDTKAGSQVPLFIHIDNAKLGQMNRGSLAVVLAFLAIALGAACAGFLLGPRKPSIDAVLEVATGDELIALIAGLDARHEAGEVSPKEYRETRAKLLAMARYLLPELEGRGSGPEPPATGEKKGEGSP